MVCTQTVLEEDLHSTGNNPALCDTLTTLSQALAGVRRASASGNTLIEMMPSPVVSQKDLGMSVS
jgi:hypothetical protein